MNQHQAVLEYIRANGSITSLQARNDLGIIQLPCRIFRLKKRGHRFTTTQKTVATRYGETTVTEYRLEEAHALV